MLEGLQSVRQVTVRLLSTLLLDISTTSRSQRNTAPNGPSRTTQTVPNRPDGPNPRTTRERRGVVDGNCCFFVKWRDCKDTNFAQGASYRKRFFKREGQSPMCDIFAGSLFACLIQYTSVPRTDDNGCFGQLRGVRARRASGMGSSPSRTLCLSGRWIVQLPVYMGWKSSSCGGGACSSTVYIRTGRELLSC